RNYRIKYRCYARADNSFDQYLLESMHNSGCAELGIGIESGSQKFLDLINKKTRVETNVKFLKKAQSIGISAN
ncbi:MAG: hypothetical protein ABH858_05935, partial [Candidatus Omnitrophota bacterium]